MTNRLPVCVLGIHPSARGFGWIVFEGPTAPFDWGIADVRSDKNVRALARVSEILNRYLPHALTIEAFDHDGSRRRPRIRSLYREIVAEASQREIVVFVYTRAQIHHTFVGTRTRHDVAAAIAARIGVLAPRLPRPRQIWDSERTNMALFSAAACALTHFAAREQGP